MSPRPIAATGTTPDAGVPLHRQLFLVLHDEIARGALAQGDPLPTEQSLGEQFGVSRITVRRALADLAEQGYIERRHGVGSFVRQNDRQSSPAVGMSYADELKQIQFETDVEVLEYDNRPPPAGVGLRLGSAEPALHVLRLRRERRTAEPLMLTEAWLPVELSEIVTAKALTASALYDLLPTAGVVIDKLDHEVTAEVAGPATARLLDIPIGSAVIRVNRIAHAGGAPHHYLSILLSPNRSRVLISQVTSGLDEPGGVAIAHDVGGVNFGLHPSGAR
ncbi:MAG: GntR family transcriptional regulator [Mycobacterium sp.]